jgi:hypothetical protein
VPQAPVVLCNGMDFHAAEPGQATQLRHACCLYAVRDTSDAAIVAASFGLTLSVLDHGTTATVLEVVRYIDP